MEPGLKLVITLRFLATGNSYKSLEYSFRIAHNTISKFIPEVCSAIYEEYQEELFKVLSTLAEWLSIALNYSTKWNFHHCWCAIDGKHVQIRKPKQSGSLYYNHKRFCSIILLALVDADYEFIWVNLGGNRSVLDAGIFNHTGVCPALEQGLLRVWWQRHSLLSCGRWCISIAYLDDKNHTFPEEKLFNYRLSRARSVVENTFGITTYRWRCLLNSGFGNINDWTVNHRLIIHSRYQFSVSLRTGFCLFTVLCRMVTKLSEWGGRTTSPGCDV